MRDDQFSEGLVNRLEDKAIPVPVTSVDLFLQRLHADAIEANRKLVAWRNPSPFADQRHRPNRVALDRYQHWVEEQLPSSGLAQMIPDGLEAMPDIRPRVSAFHRLFYRNPETYQELLNHLYLFLEFYLDRGRRIPEPSWVLGLVAGLIAAVAFSALGFQYIGSAAVVFGAIVLVAALAFSLLEYLPYSTRGMHRTVNIASLEWYLRNTYGDPDPEIEAQELDVDWS
jgi:hypothetical protein